MCNEPPQLVETLGEGDGFSMDHNSSHADIIKQEQPQVDVCKLV